MKRLLKKVVELKKANVKRIISRRIEEFKKLRKSSNSKLFNELCFCILTANFSAGRSMKIQNEIGNGFLVLPKTNLAEKLKKYGHRFPNKRAEYIVDARVYKNSIKSIINSFEDEKELREWLVRNIRGIGYKEASHFLRNIGFDNLAIIDFHIIDILARYKIIKKPSTLTKRKYLEIENILRKIANKLNLTLAELDLYLWYMETTKILK
ncbi:MAG: N-glycosylase/DNA lyase [Candidatus Aenigmarchaeota archaeon]|nr:N-glycosylase/DNA lyase [Candidatus Aenigmarchaeota archaeon]